MRLPSYDSGRGFHVDVDAVLAVDANGNPVGGSPPIGFAAIATSDTVPVLGMQLLRIGTAGNLTLKSLVPGAQAVTFAVTAGEYVPFGSGFVMAATTASGIVAFS